MYKCILHDEVRRATVAIDANTYEEAARKYCEKTLQHHTDTWGNRHWEVSVMGVRFAAIKRPSEPIEVHRVVPKEAVVKEVKLILPAWLRN